jgi:hypothetical protein
LLNPVEGRLTQVEVEAQTGQITERQEYQIQQLKERRYRGRLRDELRWLANNA